MNYFYYNRPIISKLMPNYGPATGGNEIEVLGAAFDPFSDQAPHFRDLLETSNQTLPDQEANRMNKNDTFCIFEGVGKTKARIVSSTKAICPVPPSTKDSAELYITLNNQQYSDDEIIYYWYKAAKLYQIQPRYGPTEGGTKVHIYGTDFQKGKQI
jgi:IPT/TIG domain